MFIHLSTGKSLYVGRLFEKIQQKSPRAEHIRIRLIEPHVDMHSLISLLSEKLAPLRQQDPVLLHIDTAGVSMQELISAHEFFCVWSNLKKNVFLKPGSFRAGGVPVPSVNPGLFERQPWHVVETECRSLDHSRGPTSRCITSKAAKTGLLQMMTCFNPRL